MGKKRIFLVGLAVLAFLAAHLAGQSMSARILGKVRNEEGKPLSGVLVTAVNVTSNATLTAYSGEKDGSFRLLGLVPGIYQVSFDLEGYASYTAAGISLSVEQSVTLRIKLKKASRGTGDAAAGAAAPSQAKTSFFKQRGRFSLHFTLGMNRQAVGDSNDYLRAFSQRVAFVSDPFELLRWAVDLNGEIGFRVTPRLELAAGLGLVQGHLWNNKLTSDPPASSASLPERYLVGLDVKTIPLALVCRYWLATSSHCLFSTFAGLQYHFAAWKMETEYSRAHSNGIPYALTEMFETATRQGLGWAAGGRAEVKIDEHYSLVVELCGRWAPLRRFTGRRIYFPSTSFSNPEIIDGELWSYEFYDQDLKRWVRGLGIGEPPAGDETRNVASAKVDFSGLALRFGLLFHL